MSQILIVHGISNQYSGENELREPWYLALCDGLIRAGRKQAAPPIDSCYCPFYGDLFRPGNPLGSDFVDEEELAEADENVANLLNAIWTATSASDPAVPSPESFKETLFRAPRIAERALVLTPSSCTS
jgi:hypothetical protein